jgi:hypothetical protein
MPTTLFLTRNPLNAFLHNSLSKKKEPITQSGRFGELVVIDGPKVTDAQMIPSNGTASGAGGTNTIKVTNGTIEFTSNGGAITATKRFTTMERFLQDALLNSKTTRNPADGFVQMAPNKAKVHPKGVPYWVTYEARNSKVIELPGADGQCFRVNGGTRKGEDAVLIHEAPHVGWVVGCISPRPLNDFTLEYQSDRNPSRLAIEELIGFIGKTGKSDFFVLDW